MYEPYGFAGLIGQNRADTQAGATLPAMPGYTGIDRMDFACMRTPEDQIHWLYLYARQLDKSKVTREEAQQLVAEAASAMKAYVDEQDGAIKADVAEKYRDLLARINELTEFPGAVIDPTWGSARPIKTVVERVYGFDRPFSVSAGDYDRMGYAAAAFDTLGFTAREFDVVFAVKTFKDYLARKEG